MKVLVVLLVVSLGCANASDFFSGLTDSLKAIGSAVEQTGKDFVPYANSVGKDLLNQVKNDTLSMVGGTIANLIGDGLSKLFGLQKRGNILEGLKDSLAAIGEGFKQTGKDFLPYAETVGKDLLKTAENDTISMVGGTLAKLVGDGLSKLFHLGKRDAAHMLEQGKHLMVELKNLLDLGENQYSAVIDEVFTELHEISTHLSQLNIHPQDAINKLETLLAKHTSLSREFLAALERDVNTIVESVFHKNKRNVITDTFHSLGSLIASAFKPALDKITQLVSKAKDVLTSIAHNLLNVAQSSASTLGEQLKGQVQSMKGQIQQTKTDGKDAFTAVKGAVVDMLNQKQ